MIHANPGKSSHPRLLFGPSDIAGLREKVRREPYRAMFERLARDAETNDRGVGRAAEGDYGEATAAHRCAFLYVLTEDDRWAKKARAYVERGSRIGIGATRSSRG
jgi:hypothetical protein